MKITRIHATEDGGSHFGEIEIPIDNSWEWHGYTLFFSTGYTSPEVRFFDIPEGYDTGWMHTPAAQIVVVLSGVIEVRTSAGQTQQWGPGEVLMPADLTGQGHKTRTIGGPARLLFVPLPQGFDPQRWSM